MKKIILLLLSFSFLQSCFSYKPTAYEELKADKYYVMQLNNDMRVRGFCDTMASDTVAFRVKDRLLKYAKRDITEIKRKKVSLLKSAGVFAAISGAAVLSVTTNDQTSAFEKTYSSSN